MELQKHMTFKRTNLLKQPDNNEFRYYKDYGKQVKGNAVIFSFSCTVSQLVMSIIYEKTITYYQREVKVFCTQKLQSIEQSTKILTH